MTAEEYLKTWERFDESINMGDALEACRLSKIEALEDMVKLCESYVFPPDNDNQAYYNRGQGDTIAILTNQINELKNEHTKNAL